jgi:phage shock protein PspC (stress-responsive transcriptional regulator)
MSVYSVFCVIIPLALMIYSMRGFEDNFYIKLEFKWSILVALINVLCSGLGSYFATRPDLIRIIPIVSGVIPLFFYIVVSIYLVIYWTYSHKRKFNRKRRKSSADSVDCSLASASGTTRRNSTASLKDDLKSMLKNKVARDNFLEFLKKEFSVENILLYDACTKFKKMISDAPQQLAWEYACEIYEKFIDPRGPLTVNISDTSRRKLSISFESNEALSEGIPIASIVTTTSDEQISKNHKPIPADFSAEIFEEAQQEILNLLATDSFLRFKQQSTFSPRWLSSTI